MLQVINTALVSIVIALIYIYKYTLSLFIGRQCNFYPTCSSYAIDAMRKYGIIRGTRLAFIRVCKCNPMNKAFKHDEP